MLKENVTGPLNEALFLCGEVLMGLFYDAANAWNDLLGCAYSISYGFRGTKYTLDLSFDAANFHHLAGFQHLPNPPRYNKGKICRLILDGVIDCSCYEKTSSWPDIEPRLKALARLQALLDSDFSLYKFNPYLAKTNIPADFLITDSTMQDIVFLFLGKSENLSPDNPTIAAHCKSIFMKSGDRDFTFGQRRLTILEKVKRSPAPNNSDGQ